MIKITILRELKNLNYQFLENDKNGLKINNKSYIYKVGKIPIILSAPHAVKQIRNSEVKLSDYLTGALTLFIAEQCNCSYFVRVYNDNDDPNFPIGETLLEIDNEYLRTLKEFIQEYRQLLVIDIHGCSNKRNFDCSLWHDNYKTCEEEIIKSFKNNLTKNNFSVDNGSEYLGGQVTRQSSFVTNAFQLEIKRRIRSLKKEDYYLIKSFIYSMEKSINETYEYFSTTNRVRKM